MGLSKKTSLVTTSCAGLVTALAGTSAGAQTAVSDAPPAASGELQEIVVNAQRRSENIQNVPITIEAYNEEQLKSNSVTSVTDLGVVTPGMVAASQFGYFQPHLRGVGTTAPSSSVENPVAVYVDGVYYGAAGGSLLALEGIDHLEIDKGPQGTLFGRNATGGLIQIVTKDPQQQFSGTASVTAGDYATVGGSLYMTGGITSNLASNISVYYQNQMTGFGTNYFNGQDVNKAEDFAIREKNLLTLSDDDSILLAADYEQDSSSPVLVPSPGTTPLGGPPYTGQRWSANGYFQPFNNSHQMGVSLKYSHDFGFATLESLTALLKSALDTSLDGTLVIDPAYALNIELVDMHTQVTQEIDLHSKPGSDITWTTGVYWYDSHAQYNPVRLLGGLLAPLTSYLTYSNARDLSYALFGQATKEIFNATHLTLGVRETVENKTFSESQYGGFPDGSLALFGSATGQKNHTTKPTWRFALDHQLTPDALLYASYNRGYKSGGFDDQQLPVRTYQPETLDAFEVGNKTALLNHHLDIDTAAFYYNYKNVQTVAYPAGTEIIYSAPKARLYGFDLDVKAAPFTNFTISAGMEYLHATYTDFPGAQLSIPAVGGGSILATLDATGNRMPLAPTWTFDIAPVYDVPLGAAGDLSLAAIYSYNNGFFYEPDNRLRQGAYGVLNMSATWTPVNDRYSIRLWGKNLQNTAYTTANYAQSNGDYAAYAPPRTFGVTLSTKF